MATTPCDFKHTFYESKHVLSLTQTRPLLMTGWNARCPIGRGCACRRRGPRPPARAPTRPDPRAPLGISPTLPPRGILHGPPCGIQY